MSQRKTELRNFVKRYCNNKLAVLGLVIFFLIVAVVLIAPLLIPYGEAEIDVVAFSAAPSSKHLLGTDTVGRDVLARLLYGGRVSLFVGVVSTAISVSSGSLLVCWRLSTAVGLKPLSCGPPISL